MRDQARVVVIGGGAMGVSLLYHLTKHGWDDVVLVEKNELTAGSTWHAAGLCTHYAHNITVMNLRAHSVRLYNGILEQETGQPVSFHQCGALRVTRYKDRLDEFKHVQGIGKFAGYDFHILSPTELKQVYPLANTSELIGAIYEPLDGYVDPSQATHAMAQGARNGGAEIYRHNQVNAIEQITSGEWLVDTLKGSIRCEHVVNAAGTWCREIGTMMGVDLPVVPMLHQYLVTDRVEEFAQLDSELPMIRDPDESWYLRQERDGLIIGPYEPDGHPWAIDGVPEEFGMELLPPNLDAIEDIVACAMQRVPASATAGIKDIINGPITFTPDANPLIGPAFNLTNAWLLTGSSMGVMEGGGSGWFLAEWIVNGEPPMDALAIDSRRFGGYADRDYRVSKAVECFAAQFGIHYPYEERPAGRPKLTNPIYQTLKEKGAVFGSVYGWERPNWFAVKGEHPESVLSFQRSNWFEAVSNECRIVQERVGIADVSVFSKFEVKGQDATKFIDNLGANAAPQRDGSIVLTHALTPNDGVISEFSVTRLSDQHYYLVSAAVANRMDEDLLRDRSHGFDVVINNITSDQGVLAVMGPMSRELLSKRTDADLSNAAFPWLSAQQIKVAGIDVIALRVSYVGELGWELHHKFEHQLELFNTLYQAGQEFEVGLFGAFAMNSMRLEKGYRAWGSDLTIERTPIEAGLKFLVKTDNRGFIGKDVLLARSNAVDAWQMHLLELDEQPNDPFYMHTILSNNEPVGIVTSGSYGHRVQRPLALAYFSQPVGMDETFRISILDTKVNARILSKAPYDPNNSRMKA